MAHYGVTQCHCHAPWNPRLARLFRATRNHHRLLCLNDLDFMPENHALFSSPFPEKQRLLACSLRSTQRRHKCSLLMVACDQIAAVIPGTRVWKRFCSLIRDCGCGDHPPPPPTTSGEHFPTSVFGCVERFPNAQQSRTVGCEGRDGETLMSPPQEAHCRANAPENVLRLPNQCNYCYRSLKSIFVEFLRF